nr:pectin acetylesterase 8-like [Ipomoea trifida]
MNYGYAFNIDLPQKPLDMLPEIEKACRGRTNCALLGKGFTLLIVTNYLTLVMLMKLDPATNLTYRGAKVFDALMEEFKAKGMRIAKNAIFAGNSAGVVVMLHCDRFRALFPNTTRVKCIAVLHNSLQYVNTPIFLTMSAFDQTQLKYALSMSHEVCVINNNCTLNEMKRVKDLRLDF